jgi:hypothetical protein
VLWLLHNGVTRQKAAEIGWCLNAVERLAW